MFLLRIIMAKSLIRKEIRNSFPFSQLRRMGSSPTFFPICFRRKFFQVNKGQGLQEISLK